MNMIFFVVYVLHACTSTHRIGSVYGCVCVYVFCMFVCISGVRIPASIAVRNLCVCLRVRVCVCMKARCVCVCVFESKMCMCL